MKVAVVTTTIREPKFLESYYHESSDEVTYYVIGDNKTPNIDSWTRMDDKESLEYYDMKRQTEWISDTYPTQFDGVWFAIPENSIRRRNLGYLIALQEGADIIVTVDDDNFQSAGWLGEHKNALGYYDGSNIKNKIMSRNGVVNPCHQLHMSHSNVYPRGYPFSKYWSDTFETIPDTQGQISLNMGLCTGAPDVDGFTNLLYPDLTSYKIRDNCYFNIVYDSDYMPINTQNTAFRRELTPAFYAVRMDETVNGLQVDRYDDIWGGWFLQKCMHEKYEQVSFGEPVSLDMRNKHDYITDLRSEAACMSINNMMFDIVDSLELEGNSYTDLYLDLTDKLCRALGNVPDVDWRKYFTNMIRAMSIWSDLCEVVM